METVEVILGIEGSALAFSERSTIGELTEGRVVLDEGLNMPLWTRSVITAGEGAIGTNLCRHKPVASIVSGFRLMHM